jgi:hypothetical protein
VVVYSAFRPSLAVNASLVAFIYPSHLNPILPSLTGLVIVQPEEKPILYVTDPPPQHSMGIFNMEQPKYPIGVHREVRFFQCRYSMMSQNALINHC